MSIFRELSADEEKTFRQWARDNYTQFDPIEGIWHPVIQDECTKINDEAEIEINKLLDS
jgi:hypothetical protein